MAERTVGDPHGGVTRRGFLGRTVTFGVGACAACGSDKVRPTLRMGNIQYYCCKGCGFCWRAETFRPSSMH